MSYSRLKERLRNLLDYLKPQIARIKSNKIIRDFTKTLQPQVARLRSSKTIRDLSNSLQPQIAYIQSKKGRRNLSLSLPVLIAFVLSIAVLSGGLRFFSGDIESARFILGTIAGVLAVLWALLMTVPFIALQMFVSRYGSRIYETIINRRVAIFLLVFAISFLYPVAGLFVLHLSDASKIVSIGAILAGMTVFLTIPYVWMIKDSLRTETLIDLYADSAITAISREDSKSAEDSVEMLFSLTNRAIGETDLSTFRHCVIRLLDIWKSKPKLAVHRIIGLRFAGQLEMACNNNETVARYGLDALINIINNASESKDRETWGNTLNLIEDLCDSLQPNSCLGLRLHWVEILGGLGKLVASNDPDLSLRIADALAGPLGTNNTVSYTASRSIRWVVWIFESLGSLETFCHVVDVLDGLLNNPAKELDPEFRRTVIEELYHLGQIATFRVRGSDRAGMLEYLIPKLPSTTNETQTALLPILGAYTIAEEEELKELQPKIVTRLLELAETSRMDNQQYLRRLFLGSVSAARRMNLDLPISEFEKILDKERVRTETVNTENEKTPS